MNIDDYLYVGIGYICFFFLMKVFYSKTKVIVCIIFGLSLIVSLDVLTQIEFNLVALIGALVSVLGLIMKDLRMGDFF